MKKQLVILVVALLAIGIATAALVSYLSNTITAEVNVESPMTIMFEDTGFDTKVFDVYGGDSLSYTTLAENHANNAVDVYKVVHQIEAPNEWDGTEFNSINLVDRGIDMGDVLPYMCHIKPDGTLIPFTNISGEHTTTAKLIANDGGGCGDVNIYSHPSGSVIDNDITITLNAAIEPGQYVVKICHLYDLTGNC